MRDRPKTQPRVVVIGSGFGGFFAARRLQRGAVDLTVLSPNDGMLYQPLLPDVAVGSVNPRSIIVPLAPTLPGARILRGRATAVDLENRTISYTAADTRNARLDYDWLLLAPGSVTRLFDIPGLAEHATGLKTISEAMYLRDHLLTCLEVSEIGYRHRPTPDCPHIRGGRCRVRRCRVDRPDVSAHGEPAAAVPNGARRRRALGAGRRGVLGDARVGRPARTVGPAAPRRRATSNFASEPA